jgi:hypothetical protein
VSTVDDVRRLLSSAPGDPLCAACLAFACATSLREMLAVTETLLEADRDFHRGVLALVAAVLCQRFFYRAVPTSGEAATRCLVTPAPHRLQSHTGPFRPLTKSPVARAGASE